MTIVPHKTKHNTIKIGIRCDILKSTFVSKSKKYYTEMSTFKLHKASLKKQS